MASQNNKLVNIKQAPAQKTLSKAQKLFNSLIKKIDAQKKLLREWQVTIPAYESKVAQAYEPAWQEFNETRIAFARLLDGLHDQKALTKRERDKVAHIIGDIVGQAFESPDCHEQIKDLYNKYQGSDLENDKQAQEAEAAEMMKSMMKGMFDIDMPELDMSDLGSAEALFKEKAQEKMRLMEEEAQQAEARKSQRKKTPKQLEKEAKQQAQEQNISKSIQEVYRQLVKTLHPDREPDETERQRKTQLMQRVNTAYEKKDLLQLLELQLETEQIDQDHLNNIAEDRLKYFNKVLQGQLHELDDEIGMLESSLAFRLSLPPFQPLSPKQLLWSLDQDIQDIKHNICGLKADMQAFQDIKNVKAFLKGYQIPKGNAQLNEFPDDFDELNDFMGDLEMLISSVQRPGKKRGR